MASESAVAAVRRYLEAVRAAGIRASRAVICGSEARGEAHEWSDIDIVVIPPEFDLPAGPEGARAGPDPAARTRRALVTKLWELTADVDSRIEPVACGEREWETDDGRTILEVARREGVVVTP